MEEELMTPEWWLCDTNVLYSNLDQLADYNIVITSHVYRELENHKAYHGDDEGKKERGFKARRAVRYLRSKDNQHKIKRDFKDYKWTINSDQDSAYVDNLLIQACVENGYGIITNDGLVQEKADMYRIPLIELNDESSVDDKNKDTYCGYKEVVMTEEQLSYFYENPSENIAELLVNEYIIIYNEDDDEVDCLKWNGETHIECQEKNLNTLQLGKFKPLDLQQVAAIDSLITNDVTLLRGRAGSGKSLVALTYALHQLEKGKIARLVILVNPVPVHGAQELGFYKGTLLEKLMQSGIGNILTSKIGDKTHVEAMIATGKIVLIPFVDIRGYDTGSNSLVWITEAQNLNIPLMKLGLQRIGKGSKIIIDGDDKAQVDKSMFAGRNNGIRRMSQIFRGKDLYGEVEFTNIYRSKIAEIADDM